MEWSTPSAFRVSRVVSVWWSRGLAGVFRAAQMPVLEGLDPGGVGYESIVSERVRWQLRSLMHHNECCNAENSKV